MMRTSGKRRRISSTEPSRDPLSTTRIVAPPRSAAARLSRQATVSAARFQLSTTIVTRSEVTGSAEPEPFEGQRRVAEAVAEPPQVLDQLGGALGAMDPSDVGGERPEQSRGNASELPQPEPRRGERPARRGGAGRRKA